MPKFRMLALSDEQGRTKLMRFQRRFFFIWRNCDLEGKFYHPEQLQMGGHIAISSWEEGTKILRCLRNPIKKPDTGWKPIDI